MTKHDAEPDAYLDTVKRLEPDIAMIDTGAGLASIAVSLKRIADAMTAQQLKFYDIAIDKFRPARQEDLDNHVVIVQEIAKRFPEDLMLVHRKLRAEGKIK